MSFFERLFSRQQNYPVEYIDGDQDVPGKLYWQGESPVFWLPPEMLTWHGTQRFVANHPLVQAITQGEHALQRYYTEFCPANLAQMHGVIETGLQGENLPPWCLPWCAWAEQRPPSAEAGLDAVHGVSYYGPCSPQKVAVEYQRMSYVTDSIVAKGYQPARNGHIEGYFMRSGARFRFFVQGGKHRAAALVALGFERIPVRIRQTWPRVIAAGSEKDWPMVRDGQLAPELAERVLARYFQDDRDGPNDRVA